MQTAQTLQFPFGDDKQNCTTSGLSCDCWTTLIRIDISKLFTAFWHRTLIWYVFVITYLMPHEGKVLSQIVNVKLSYIKWRKFLWFKVALVFNQTLKISWLIKRWEAYRAFELRNLKARDSSKRRIPDSLVIHLALHSYNFPSLSHNCGFETFTCKCFFFHFPALDSVSKFAE